MSFEYYLKRKKLLPSSIESYKRSIGYFKKWMFKNGLNKEDLRYQEMLLYVDNCRTNGNSQRTIQHKIRIIKYWLDYQFKHLRPNPCTGLVIKDHGRPLPSPLLTEVELNELYRNYPEDTDLLVRNKVILGLMCYQALPGGELIKLRLEDVKLEYQAIILKKGIKSNGRSIAINDHQKSILEPYIKTIRGRLLAEGTSDKLIVKPGQNERLKNTLCYFYASLRKMYPKFKSPHQLRASVISNWLKHYNLREVQRMAGHKYVSSTERYLVSNVDGLQKSLDKLHPWK